MIAVATAALALLCSCSKKSDWELQLERTITEGPTEHDRNLATIEYRIFKHVEKHGDFSSLLRLDDGIDAAEAYLIAQAYFDHVFGSCGGVDLPERKGGDWVVRTWAGRTARPQPPVYIDARTGTMRCEGHADESNASDLVRKFELAVTGQPTSSSARIVPEKSQL